MVEFWTLWEKSERIRPAPRKKLEKPGKVWKVQKVQKNSALTLTQKNSALTHILKNLEKPGWFLTSLEKVPKNFRPPPKSPDEFRPPESPGDLSKNCGRGGKVIQIWGGLWFIETTLVSHWKENLCLWILEVWVTYNILPLANFVFELFRCLFTFCLFGSNTSYSHPWIIRGWCLYDSNSTLDRRYIDHRTTMSSP